MYFIFVFLVAHVVSLREQKVEIIRSNFTGVINLYADCEYKDQATAPRYTTACNRILRNSWSGISQDSSVLGGAISIVDLTLVILLDYNSFINCRSKSGGACALSCKNVTFQNNIIQRCITSSSKDADGSVYIYSINYTPMIYYYGENNYYSDNDFFKGGGLESSCTNVMITLKNESYIRCKARNFGGGIHLNNFQGSNDIIDCFFINCTSMLAGGIGYDCPAGSTKRNYSMRILGCLIEGCSATSHGSAIYNYYRRPSTLDVVFSKSFSNNTVIKKCIKYNEVMYITATSMDLSFLNITDTVGSVFVVNSAGGDLVLRSLKMTNCSFLRVKGKTSSDGFVMSGRFGNLTITGCMFNDIPYMWNFPIIGQFIVHHSIFRAVNDAGKTSLATTNRMFSFLYQNCLFIDSTISVRITTKLPTNLMKTTFNRCMFIDMDKELAIDIPTEIQVIDCRYDGKASMFKFSSSCRSVIISDCNLRVNKSGLTLFKMEGLSPSAPSEVRNCRFTVDAGYAIAFTGKTIDTNMKIKNCTFDGNSNGAFISLSGNFYFEENTFKRGDLKTTPVIQYLGGKMSFSKINRNCIMMSYFETFSLENSSLYDSIVDSDNMKIDRWNSHNNLCFLDSTADFTYSQQFSMSKEFEKTQQFSSTQHFTFTKDFPKTDVFPQSTEFSYSKHFTSSKDFSGTNEFQMSSYFTQSNVFLKSSIFQNTKHFTCSNDFVETPKFSQTREFSQTDQLESTIEFTISSQYSKSIHFAKSTNFLATTYFSESKQFAETIEFSISNELLRSIGFSESNSFASIEELIPLEIDTSQKIKMFRESVIHNKESEVNDISSSLVIEGQDDHLVKITNEQNSNKEKKDKGNKGILAGFTIGLLAVFALLVTLMALLIKQKRREDESVDIFESNEEVINAELNPTSTTNANPLYDGDASIDPFEFDFIDVENATTLE